VLRGTETGSPAGFWKTMQYPGPTKCARPGARNEALYFPAAHALRIYAILQRPNVGSRFARENSSSSSTINAAAPYEPLL
jgi:hypothetical protein